MANARVQQAVVELVVLTNPNARVQQAVVELLVLPIELTAPFSVILRGVKRYKSGSRPFVCAPVDEKQHDEAMEKLTEFIG